MSNRLSAYTASVTISSVHSLREVSIEADVRQGWLREQWIFSKVLSMNSRAIAAAHYDANGPKHKSLLGLGIFPVLGCCGRLTFEGWAAAEDLYDMMVTNDA